MGDRARDKALRIMAEHTVEPLDPEIVRGMEEIVERRAAVLPPIED